MFGLILNQMVIFFLVFAVGFIASRTGVIAQEGMPPLAKLATKMLLPAMIVYSTCANCTSDMILRNGGMILLAAAFYAVISLVVFLMAKAMRLEHDKDRVFQFCFIFGNTGFVGIPLLASVLPGAGLVYMMMFTIVDQLVFWTYGVWLSTARGRTADGFSPRQLLNPNIIALVIALAILFLHIPVPDIIMSGLGTISAATPGVCMVYLGALAGFSDVRPVLKRPELYAGIVVKMVALPVAAAKVLLAVGAFPDQMVLGLAVIMALPVMTVVPMVAATNGGEGEYATGITVVTLVASIVAIPLVAFLIGA